MILSLGCAAKQAQVPFPTSSIDEEFLKRVEDETGKDPLIGIWSGTQCGRTVLLAVLLNDEGTPYKLKALILNGDQMGYGYHDGDPWFYVAPLALESTYQGTVSYRSRFFSRWFPTQIVMTAKDIFTTYDDVTILTCGGTVHTYIRNAPAGEEETRLAVSGSGFLLWNTALILTAHHVVGKAKDISIHFATGEEYQASIIARDSTNDLAILELRGFQPGDRGFQVNPQTGVGIGESVHALGYPLTALLGRQPSIVTGQVSSTVGLEETPTQFRMTAPINPGNSGGPILNERGEVVGISVSSLRNQLLEGITFGIKIATALPLLQEADVVIQPMSTHPPLTPDKIFSNHAQDVVLIEVIESVE